MAETTGYYTFHLWLQMPCTANAIVGSMGWLRKRKRALESNPPGIICRKFRLQKRILSLPLFGISGSRGRNRSQTWGETSGSKWSV